MPLFYYKTVYYVIAQLVYHVTTLYIVSARSLTGCNAEKNAPSVRVDFSVSGENVRAADKRGAGPAGLAKISDF